MTPTWAGDLAQYRVLMRSLRNSPLAGLTHTTVAQSEDEPALRRVCEPGSLIMTTADLLPKEVEYQRRRALRMHKSLGRHLTRLSGSISRAYGWPRWPRYTGWHIQQICKLAVAARAETDYLIAVDSDVIVTPSANLELLFEDPGIACFSEPKHIDEFRGKTRNWVLQADHLLNAPTPDGWHDCFFDTPFLLHTDTVRQLLNWLEQRYNSPWWQVLLSQPPRRWSEFATYKRFLQSVVEDQSGETVNWLSTSMMHYIFDASDTEKLFAEINQHLNNPATHFITVHSQSSGRQLWRAEDFFEDLIQLVESEALISSPADPRTRT